MKHLDVMRMIINCEPTHHLDFGDLTYGHFSYI
jgi:hypothetical protein